MKHKVLAIIMGLLMSVPFLVGCAAEPAAPIVLRYAGGMTLDHNITKMMYHYAEEVDRLTEGQVKLELYPAGQLYAHKDLGTAIMGRAVDLAQMSTSRMGGLSEAVGLSGMSFLFTGWEHTMRVHEAAFDIADAELQANSAKLLFWMPYGIDCGPITVDKQVKTMEDLKGLKLRVFGDVLGLWLERLGATPVFIASAEVYHALATGALDGAYSGLGSYYDRKWYEVAKYLVGTGFDFYVFVTVMNLDVWNELPKDTQAILLQAGKETTDWGLPKTIEMDEWYRAELEKEGMIIYDLTPEETERWFKVFEPIYDEWAQRSPACLEMLELAKKMR